MEFLRAVGGATRNYQLSDQSIGAPMGKKPYKVTKRKEITICEDYNFRWDKAELDELADLWSQGMSIPDIAAHFKRPQPEIVFAVVQLAEWRRLKPRKGGLMGWRDAE